MSVLVTDTRHVTRLCGSLCPPLLHSRFAALATPSSPANEEGSERERKDRRVVAVAAAPLLFKLICYADNQVSHFFSSESSGELKKVTACLEGMIAGDTTFMNPCLAD